MWGAGLGLRRDLVEELLRADGFAPSFVELAPENWLGIGGLWKKNLDAVTERYPVTCHGLSLSIGSPDELDWELLKRTKKLLADQNVALFSEHLSYAKCDNAHLYDLLPMPFREDALLFAANRIRQVQDFLERPIAIENISYYTSLTPEMTEAEFVSGVVREAGCGLLLDVNNIYVNSQNHGYDPKSFLEKMPLDKVMGIHVAGHERRTEDLIIDTHGQAVADPVYEILEWVLPRISPVPVLLERDFNFEKLAEIKNDLARIDAMITHSWKVSDAA